MHELLGPQTTYRPADLVGSYVAVDRPCPSHRPWVLINFVATADGSAAAGGRVGGLSSPMDKHVFQLLRSVADVILVGAGTVRAEGYGPHRPSLELQASRRARGQPATATMAVVSGGLNLDLQSSLFANGARPFVIAPDNVDTAARDRTAAHAELLTAGHDTVDLGSALGQLHRRGVRLVVCEGGPLLFAQLLAGGWVDELCLTVPPLLVADPVRLLSARALDRPAVLQLAHVLEDEGHLYLRYLVARPENEAG